MTMEEFEKVTLEKLKLVDEVESGIVDCVLKIIDEENNLSKLVEETPLGCGLNDTLAQNIKNRVLALKGGEQK